MTRSALKGMAAAVLGVAAASAISGCVVLRPGLAAAGPTQSATVHTQVVPLPDAVKAKGVLTLGSQVASPPLIFFTDGNAKIEGIDKDIADEIGKRLGVQVQWQQIPFAGLIPAVQSNKVDAAIDLIGDTDQRREVVDFSDYMNQATSPLVRRGNPDGIKTVDDLCGLNVAIIRGSVQLDLAQQTSKKCQQAGKAAVTINQYGAPGDARLSVQAGRDAAFLGNTPVMRYIAEAPATKEVFEVAGSAAYQKQPVGIITAKAQSKLRDSIQSVIDVMRTDGSLAAILKKWNAEDLALEGPAGGTK